MTTKKTRAKKVTPDATPEIAWGYGIRAWAPDGGSHSGFKWDLTAGARTTCPDWNTRPECGGGLHANPDGWGDWSLLGLSEPGKIIGIIRYDSALAVEIAAGDKIKVPWAEIVMTTRDASVVSVYGFIADRWRQKMAAILKGSKKVAQASGDRGHAQASGYSGHAQAEGKFAIAAAVGLEGTARAAKTGAIMLAAYDEWDGTGYPLKAVFAGMVGQTYGGVTIEAGKSYRLGLDGVPVPA